MWLPQVDWRKTAERSQKSFKQFVYQQESTMETEKKQWSSLPKACIENCMLSSQLQ